MRLREKFRHGSRLLVVTAVEAERTAVRHGLGLPDTPDTDPDATVVVLVGGVGEAAAAAATARALAIAETRAARFDLVLSAGIAGGIPGRASIGATVVAHRIIAADLGADSPEGFLPIGELGFGSSVVEIDADVRKLLATMLPEAVTGDLLTAATVTGTQPGLHTLLDRWPGAVAEAMEGHGVAVAAGQAAVPVGEIRTISNLVGPRDRSSWRVKAALAALTESFTALRNVVAPQ